MKTMSALSPLLAPGKPVAWWFIFKFNAATFPGQESLEPNPGIFGGTPKDYGGSFCLSYACASSANPSLQMGAGYVGTSLNDPLGATFDQVYHGQCNYILWNDQFHGDPLPSRDAPWGHAKGMLAWDDAGAGFVMQVSTPSWPASGSASHPRRTDGNTLGCVKDDDVMVSQHFFALRLTATDVATVLAGLANASVATARGDLQIFNAGGPANLQELAQQLGGRPSSSTQVTMKTLSTGGVTMISKPSNLNVPPWQMVSAQLGGLGLRVASWWGVLPDPSIPTTTARTPVTCWNSGLEKPGPVQIATLGAWEGRLVGLRGGNGKHCNHSKIGVSLDAARPLCIFGDLNQQGTLSARGGGNDGCAVAQNGRGGTFYALEQTTLWRSLSALLRGETAPRD
jgi:hypothetical protein